MEERRLLYSFILLPWKNGVFLTILFTVIHWRNLFDDFFLLLLEIGVFFVVVRFVCLFVCGEEMGQFYFIPMENDIFLTV